MASKQAITKALALLSQMGMRGGPASPDEAKALVAVWEALIPDVADEDLHAACVAYIRDPEVCQYWPQPGKLLERIPGRRAEAVDASDEAWGQLLRLVQAHGYYSPPGDKWQIDDPAMAAGLQACGGWRSLCHSQNLTADRASFRSAYRGTVDRARELTRDGEAVAVLGGSKVKAIGGGK